MSVSIRRTDSDRRIGLDERRRGMVAAYVLLGVFAVSGCSLAPIIRPRHCQSHRPIPPTRERWPGQATGGRLPLK